MPFPVRDLPDIIPPYVPPTSSLSRASANRINSASTRVQEITMSLPGYDETVPLVYGEDRMAGLWLVRPYTHIGSGELRFAIAWSWGGEKGIEGVQTIFANGAALPGGVVVTHYYGTAEQGIDPTLSADIPGFGDAYKYLAYTVFRVPPATIVGFPQTHQIEAVVRGIRVLDPRLPDTPPISARYWGVRVTATPRDSTSTYPRFYLAELDMRETRGGTSAIGSGTPGASAGVNVANLFDGDPSTNYTSGSGNDVPITVWYDFGSAITIQEFSIQVRTTSFSSQSVPTDFEFVYSDDGSTWTAVGTFLSLTWSAGEIKTYSVNAGGNVVYSENPALCMADFISRPEEIGGVGKDVFGVEECADRCDQLLGGQPRSEIGLTIKQADYLDAMLDMFSAYAEVLWSYEEGGVLMVPDAPVEEPAYVFDYNDIKNLRLLGNEMTQSPTSVTVNIRIATGTEESWPQFPAVQYLPGVEEGEIEDVPSDLFMPGIHRTSEGLRKALMRLRRLSYPSRFAFQTFDEGVQFQRGDVVQLPDELGLNTRLVRILSIEQIAPGRYQHTAEHYSPDMYPDDYIPGNTANWPVGSAFFFRGSQIPSGYELFEDADGLPIYGASSLHPAGTIDGDGSIDYGTQYTSYDGAHGGDATTAWVRGPAGFDSFTTGYKNDVSDHRHQYTQTGPYSRQPFRRQERIIVKTGSPGEMPAFAECFSDGEIISATLSEVTSYLGRLAAGGSPLNAGSSHEFVSTGGAGNLAPVFAGAGAHSHNSGATDRVEDGPYFGPYPTAWLHVDAPNHTHGASLTFTLNPKRKNMVFYEASSDTPAQVGLVAMYLGDPEDLDGTGFYLCDGNNGTVDLEDFFIVRSSSTDAGNFTGDHTVSWTGTTNTHTHNHKGTSSSMHNRTGKHPNDVSHNHTVSGSVPYRPTGYSIYFIQYTGVI